MIVDPQASSVHSERRIAHQIEGNPRTLKSREKSQSHTDQCLNLKEIIIHFCVGVCPDRVLNLRIEIFIQFAYWQIVISFVSIVK